MNLLWIQEGKSTQGRFPIKCTYIKLSFNFIDSSKAYPQTLRMMTQPVPETLRAWEVSFGLWQSLWQTVISPCESYSAAPPWSKVCLFNFLWPPSCPQKWLVLLPNFNFKNCTHYHHITFLYTATAKFQIATAGAIWVPKWKDDLRAEPPGDPRWTCSMCEK